MNETFVRARTIFDRMMEDSLARHTGGEYLSSTASTSLHSVYVISITNTTPQHTTRPTTLPASLSVLLPTALVDQTREEQECTVLLHRDTGLMVPPLDLDSNPAVQDRWGRTGSRNLVYQHLSNNPNKGILVRNSNSKDRMVLNLYLDSSNRDKEEYNLSLSRPRRGMDRVAKDRCRILLLHNSHSSSNNPRDLCRMLRVLRREGSLSLRSDRCSSRVSLLRSRDSRFNNKLPRKDLFSSSLNNNLPNLNLKPKANHPTLTWPKALHIPTPPL
jgi:hypothetical protein